MCRRSSSSPRLIIYMCRRTSWWAACLDTTAARPLARTPYTLARERVSVSRVGVVRCGVQGAVCVRVGVYGCVIGSNVPVPRENASFSSDRYLFSTSLCRASSTAVDTQTRAERRGSERDIGLPILTRPCIDSTNHMEMSRHDSPPATPIVSWTKVTCTIGARAQARRFEEYQLFDGASAPWYLGRRGLQKFETPTPASLA